MQDEAFGKMPFCSLIQSPARLGQTVAWDSMAGNPRASLTQRTAHFWHPLS